MSTPFDRANQSLIEDGSRRSAGIVIPELLALVGPIESAVDLGCGNGTWLAAIQQAGVSDVLGLEAGEIDVHELPRALIRHADLEKPVTLERRYDLALSLEVAEHLPEASARTFVRSLCAASDLILFSAAIPYQGGQWHINLQWPRWWYRLFRDEGYECFDALRRRLWNDERIEPWYRQNMLLYARCQAAERLAERYPAGEPLDLVHPRIWEGVASLPRPDDSLGNRAKTALRRRLNRHQGSPS